jgi:DNA-binding Lrp family transcriptional regulator
MHGRCGMVASFIWQDFTALTWRSEQAILSKRAIVFTKMRNRIYQIGLSVDEIDRQLLTILRHDARRSISDIALELDVSRATVRTRIERMEARGDIVGYTVVLRADAVADPVRGLTMIEVEGRMLDRVVDALAGFPEIGAVHTTNGRWDVVVEMSAQSLADLDACLRRLRLVPGITASETTLLLSTPRSSRARL